MFPAISTACTHTLWALALDDNVTFVLFPFTVVLGVQLLLVVVQYFTEDIPLWASFPLTLNVKAWYQLFDPAVDDAIVTLLVGNMPSI